MVALATDLAEDLEEVVVVGTVKVQLEYLDKETMAVKVVNFISAEVEVEKPKLGKP